MIVGLLILQSYRQMTPLSRHTEQGWVPKPGTNMAPVPM